MEFRREHGGRTNYIARLGPIRGVGPLSLTNIDGEFGPIDQQLWRVIFDKSPTKVVKVKIEPKPGVTRDMEFPVRPIDVFTPKVLLREDFMGVGYASSAPSTKRIDLSGNVYDVPAKPTYKFNRLPGTDLVSLVGTFRVNDLTEMNFSKPIKFVGVLTYHDFAANLSTVTEKAFVESLAKAGQYRLEESKSEYRLTLDPLLLSSQLQATRTFYSKVNTRTYFGAKIDFQLRAAQTLTPDEIESICRGSILRKNLPMDSPLRQLALSIVDRKVKATPEIEDTTRRKGNIRLVFEDYLKCGIEIETIDGSYRYF
jgi:hypothetical protein